ncbi:hypothetical protein BCR43DRAFT_498404 [Syncephalastrum racemosum]|uniref:Transglutaminase-like domain-containing protein n=1 Tax=Syncephalastrum racemosum TaxID=13706 RepID=A0A1X2H0V9_SYNRA|nr:hypothetical protein BCR43DRAFT_498404 [Syncephalastrum racemosum]
MEASAINAIATRITQEWVQQLRQRGRDIPSTIHITPNEHMLVVQLTLMWATLDLRHLTIPKAIKEQSFLDELRMYSRRVLRYEDKELLDRALEVIPVHRFYEEAAEKPNAPLDDEVIRRLLHWFKNDFFTWINQPPCDFCGASETQSAGTADPSEDDRRWGARIVELYKCTKCRKVTRFARYNDPGKLLETRRGRCGEWANCFTLCCRAIGSEARLVLDKTDHVWTEIYSENKQRWVHCDPAEEAFDQPMLYTVGWGKKLTYCIGFSCDEAVDVTKRYTKDWSQVLERRNLVDENVLAKFLDDLSAERQKDLPQERKAILKERRMREKKELDETTPGIKESETVGRQSGLFPKWKKARGEYRG